MSSMPEKKSPRGGKDLPELESSPSLMPTIEIYQRIVQSLKQQGEAIYERLDESTKGLPSDQGTRLQTAKDLLQDLINRLDTFSRKIAGDFPVMTPEETEAEILQFFRDHPGADVEHTLASYNPSEDIKARIRHQLKESA